MEALSHLWSKEYPGDKSRRGPLATYESRAGFSSSASEWPRNRSQRNLPTKDWSPEAKNPRYPPGPFAGSEPENQALVRLIETCRPVAILSAHSFSKVQVNINGPSREWGEKLSSLCGYPITEDIGYPTPGASVLTRVTSAAFPRSRSKLNAASPRSACWNFTSPLCAKLSYWENVFEKGPSTMSESTQKSPAEILELLDRGELRVWDPKTTRSTPG